MVKKLLALFLVVLMSIDNLAAVVSDNDGSVFITKAEFEALKTNFATQINNYNDSIDKKIDGAIASYLAGIKISQAPTIVYNKLKDNVGGDFWVKNVINDVGTSDIDTNVKLNLTRRYNYKYFDNLRQVWNIHVNKNGNNWNVWVGSELVSTDHIGDYTSGNSFFCNDISPIHTPFGPHADTTVTKYLKSSWSGWSWFINVPSGEYEINTMGTRDLNFLRNPLTTQFKETKNNVSIDIPGQGKAWIHHKNPDGSIVLREFAPSIYIVQSIKADAHTYKSFGEDTDQTETSLLNYYCQNNGLADNTDLSLTVPDKNEYGDFDCGESNVADDSTDNQVWWEYKISQVKATDSVDYSVFQWGKNTNTVINCIEDIQQPILGTEKTIAADMTKSTFNSIYFTPKFVLSQTNDLSGLELKYKEVKLETTGIALNQLSNSFLTAIAGENVKIGGGLPIIDVLDNGQKIVIKLKFKCRDGDGNDVSTDTVSYQISNKQFVNGSINPDAGTVDFTSGIKSATVGNEIEVVVEDYKGLVWLNMYSNTLANDVAISDLKIETF